MRETPAGSVPTEQGQSRCEGMSGSCYSCRYNWVPSSFLITTMLRNSPVYITVGLLTLKIFVELTVVIVGFIL